MEHTPPTERGWIWLLRAAGVLLGVFVAANVIDLVTHVTGPSGAPAAVASRPAPGVPAAYHPGCIDGSPTLAARFDRFVERVLPGRLRRSEVAPVRCHKCGERIAEGSEIVLLER